jgi:PDZ domain-containing protein
VRRHLSPARLLIAALALVTAVVAVLFLVPADDTFLFLPDDPHAVEPLIAVEGRRPPADDGGGIFFVDVIVRRPTLIERLLPGLFHDGASVVPEHAINPTGLSDEERRRASLQVMTRSQRIAAAVALREAGFDVTARATGAFVAQVLPDSPAVGAGLRPSDVITEVDGRRIRTLDGLQRALLRRRPGDTVEVAVRRQAETKRFRIELAPSPADRSRGAIGVLVEQAVDVRLPVDVKIEAGNVGGPSAGLAFALGLLEELGRDVDHGRRVAVTGEIHLNGAVGAVGGIRQKTIGAREGGVDAFVVPAGDNAAEARRYADGLRIVPVKTFQQALRALATIPESDQD